MAWVGTFAPLGAAMQVTFFGPGSIPHRSGPSDIRARPVELVKLMDHVFRLLPNAVRHPFKSNDV
jgi:hypothetical protein